MCGPYGGQSVRWTEESKYRCAVRTVDSLYGGQRRVNVELTGENIFVGVSVV
jgi:hypothetical protein